MRNIVLGAVAMALAACGQDAESVRGGSVGEAPDSTTTAATVTSTNRSSRTDRSPPADFAGRTAELAQPDAAAMVFLYYDLAKLPPPIEQWVERDTRVLVARPADKPAERERVRAELTAGLQSVANVGLLRMSFSANLTDYDPAYQEFTVRAFAPSSLFEFKALDQRIQVKFTNAVDAQSWSVPADQAQSIRDRLTYDYAKVDALLRIVDVQSLPRGGVINTEVLSYEIRSARGGQLLGRVELAK